MPRNKLVSNMNMEHMLKRLNQKTDDQLVWDILMAMIKSGQVKINIHQNMEFNLNLDDISQEKYYEEDHDINQYDYYNDDDYYKITLDIPINMMHTLNFKDGEHNTEIFDEADYEYTLEEAFVLIKRCLSPMH